jgi:hypothetical protein
VLLTTGLVYAFEDCIITSDGKLTDINIEDNTVIDVFPIITIMNEKNTLIVHPLKAGKTRFCALKNGKNLALFEVQANDVETIINAPDGFEVLTLDTPNNEFEFELDEPPGGNVTKK